MATLTQTDVKRRFNYDLLTGLLTWCIRPSNNTQIGMRAGSFIYDKTKTVPKRRHVTIDGCTYKEHQIIWLWMTGKWPLMIDHKDGDPFNNKWRNLRLATHTGNNLNRRNCRPGRLKWTYPADGGRYRARVSLLGRRYNLGVFDTEQEAHDVACTAAQQLHGQFARSS